MTKTRDTRSELRRAILRIEHRRPKRISKERCRINISMVAREAGVTPACIGAACRDDPSAAAAAQGIRARCGPHRFRERAIGFRECGPESPSPLD